MLAFEVEGFQVAFAFVCTRSFGLPRFGVGADGLFSTIQINCILYNSLQLESLQSFIIVLVWKDKLSIPIMYYDFLLKDHSFPVTIFLLILSLLAVPVSFYILRGLPPY